MFETKIRNIVTNKVKQSLANKIMKNKMKDGSKEIKTLVRADVCYCVMCVHSSFEMLTSPWLEILI